MVSQTQPKARQRFAKSDRQVLNQDIDHGARKISGRDKRRIRDNNTAAGTANIAAASAQETADAKLSLVIADEISTDADETWAATDSNTLTFLTGALTTDRALTLEVADAGWSARFVRTGTGGFNQSIGGLKDLTTDTWCDIYCDGSTWVLTAYGTL